MKTYIKMNVINHELPLQSGLELVKALTDIPEGYASACRIIQKPVSKWASHAHQLKRFKHNKYELQMR